MTILTQQEVVNQILRSLQLQWAQATRVPFPHCRIEDTGDPAAPYSAQLYYNSDEKVLTFHYDGFGELIATGETINIDPDTHYRLIPVYPEVKDIPSGFLLTFTTSGLLYYAHGRVGAAHVDYYHCPVCNGFISGLPDRKDETRAGFLGKAFYCRRCVAELTFNTPINARKG